MGLFFREVKPKFDLFIYLEENLGEVAILAGLLLLLLVLLWRCLSGKNAAEPEPVPPKDELHLPIADSNTEEEAADHSTPRRSARLRNKRSASIN